jgi:hypothetical protein
MDDKILEIEQFISDKEIVLLCKKFSDHKFRDLDDGFNFFKVISDNYQKENLHSDILGFLLNPDESHQMGRTFLDLFLTYINDILKIEVDFIDFDDDNLEGVTREKGRIDVSIRGKTKVIMIENKINTLSDTDQQIPTYVQRVKNSGKEVLTVLYCTLTYPRQPERKKWETFTNQSIIDEIDNRGLIKSVSFYNRTDTDLYSGWLDKCIQKSKDDLKIFLKHYQNTLKSLGERNMTSEQLKDFYELVLDEKKFNITHSIKELCDELDEYRTQRFLKSYGSNCQPFNFLRQYSNVHVFFETRSIYKGHRIKLDIDFGTNKSFLRFWDNDKDPNDSSNPIKEILSLMEIKEEFVVQEPDNYTKTFKFPSKEIDFIDFINSFLQKFSDKMDIIKSTLSKM